MGKANLSKAHPGLENQGKSISINIKHLIILICLLPGARAIGQDTLNVSFNNGRSKNLTLIYDDPFYHSRAQLDLRPVNVLGIGDGLFAFQAKSRYYLSYEKWLDFGITLPYFKSTSETFGNDINEQFSFFEINGQFHYRLFGSTRPVRRKVIIDTEYSGSTETRYRVKIPRKISRSFELDGGLNYQKRLANTWLNTQNKFAVDTGFYLSSTRFLSIEAGASYRVVHHIRFKTDETEHAQFKNTRLYAYFTYSPLVGYSPFMRITTYDYVNGIEKFEHVKVDDGYDPITVERLGYRVGYERILGGDNKYLGLVLGVEYARIPYYHYGLRKASNYHSMDYQYFSVSLGVMIRSNSEKLD